MTSIRFRKELFADERDDDLNEIGKPVIRQDILGHVTGRTRYYDDHLFEGLLHMRCVRCPHHHAEVRSVDAAAAERMPGVVRVVRPEDVPNNFNTLLSLIGFGKDDETLLQPKKCAYRGEPVLAVIARSERQAREAAAAVRVDWQVLPHVLDVEEALLPDAPVVNEAYPGNAFEYYGRYDHQKLRFGDVDMAFREADHLVEAEYQMSPIEQAPMETCGAIAVPETNDRYLCHTATQALFFSLGTTAKLLDLPSSRLHFIGGTVGGGFGGKVDSIVEPMAVLGAMLTGRPVKFAWDRPEEMQVGAPRGAERWRIRDGVMRDGRIIARSFTGFFDAGAYTRLSSYAGHKSTAHLPGPYSIPNVAANVYCVYTNRTPATAMRGFGITGVDFGIECHMDKVAETVGMDPVELRILNAYRDGDMKSHRRPAKNTALIECCQVAADQAGWQISAEARAQDSRTGGGGERASIPETVTDDAGKIGDRRRGPVATGPLEAGTKGRVAAGSRGETIAALEPQREDMAIDPDRVGHRTGEKEAEPGAPPAETVRPAATMPTRRLTGAGPVPPAAARRETARAPEQPSAYTTTRSAAPPAGRAPLPSSASPPPAEPETPPPYKPEKPFQRGVKRPGVSRFISGMRRR